MNTPDVPINEGPSTVDAAQSSANGRWARLQEIFAGALQLPPHERPAFIAAQTAGDNALKSEVESLLRHHESANDTFLTPATPPFDRDAPPEPADRLVGQRVDEFTIDRVLAVGGMGTVYAATQDQPRRTVALKVINRVLPSSDVHRRFRFEAEVLARLRHPHIAQVYKAGTVDIAGVPVPYFALEYVPQARPIHQCAREQNLDPHARLILFAKVCDAVHHGHQRGIIHRDLKPANILIDEAGEPKVIDFGVARATDADVALTTQCTQAGQIIGTMQYMSPEQCDADPHELDTRSDVYALGVILYELMAGVLPYETGTTLIHAARIIRESPPRPLREVAAQRIHRDIETIIHKSLEKDRDRRYASVADLAQDLRRHLAGEPIEARPPTAWAHAFRWIFRHPALTTTAACLLIATLTIAATYAAVWLLYSRPYRLVSSEDKLEVQLRSLNDNVLHKWRSDPPGPITYAPLVDRPAEFGGGRLVVVAFNRSDDPQLSGALCAYNLDVSYAKPCWQRRINADDLFTELREQRGLGTHQFDSQIRLVADVFTGPTNPGPEIVVTHAPSPSCETVIRIYDLRGNVLYQVWHDALIDNCYWVENERQLVFAAKNTAGPWWKRGRADVHGENHPRVVFAVRPKLGFIAAEFMPSEAGEGPLAPIWYKCLLPPGLAGNLGASLKVGRPSRARPGYSVEVHLAFDRLDPVVSLSWPVDAFGNETPDLRTIVDEYHRNRELPDGHPDKLPDPSVFHLGPLPPIVAADSE